jgi:sirohydrochlorin cobaltochelatase
MNGERLILFAHGSNDPVWLETFHKLARDLASQLGHDRIDLAFMEFSHPTLFDALGDALADGARDIKILPLFLSAGGHVSREIPRLIDSAKIRFPELDIELLPPIGEYRSFAALVHWIARSALSSAAKASAG